MSDNLFFENTFKQRLKGNIYRIIMSTWYDILRFVCE